MTKPARPQQTNPEQGFLPVPPVEAGVTPHLTARFFNSLMQHLARDVPDAFARRNAALAQHGPALRRAFNKRGVHFDEDIWPTFSLAWVGAEAAFLPLRTAVEHCKREYAKELRLYKGAIRLLTRPEAPLPEAVKEKLRETYAELSRCKPWELCAGNLQTAEGQDIPILSRNLAKAPHKHPVWGNLMGELFSRLTEKGVSQSQSVVLISQLFAAFLPSWKDTPSGRDSLRLRVQARVKAKRSP
jgi:hypothetical protein